MRSAPLAAVALVVVAIGAGGEDGVRKWRAPNGRLHFGDRPPPGSVPLGTVGKLVPSGDTATPDASAAGNEGAGPDAAKVVEKRTREREMDAARRETLARAVEIGPHVVNRGQSNWIVTGVVRNHADETVHDVRVAAGDAWTPTQPAEIPGRGEATFRLEVPRFPLAEDERLPSLEVRWREQ